ncbi:hypothetical protein Cob_v001666 [Colletotrichum orbiculare MAFF 240422]|uniref:Rhodopsin domain-containing protein n=1 Tax=Colletotrichum orbiculare (strain 104-T / ATCC 96160 / CBS 514.97 / LARS 414 / MAFF 240422) TaxID=1213857 RepID=N4UW35_COLOR|nr:hypothetical protein Cob_v001666 [Colletotrichum orbiculare MAFF 240422]
MVDTNGTFASRLERQSWIHYSIGIVFIILRLYSRARRLGGVREYQVDDYLQVLAAALFTTLVALLNIITDGGGSNLVPPDVEPTLTPADVEARVHGSKLVLVSEQAMLNLVYVLKACVLVLYTRLTLGLAAKRFVRYLCVYVAVGWLATQITIFAACRPFAGYWAVPPPDAQCATYENYAILQAFFNVSSDLLMLAVPLPLVARMSAPWRQRAVLVFVFGLGVCVVVAALLTKVYNLRDPYSPGYMLWYVREASVAVYVSNLPLVWPLLREWFPWLRCLKTKGVLPTPRACRMRGGGGGKETGDGSWTNTTAGGGGRTTAAASPATPTSTKKLMARSATYSEFGPWYRAGDIVELQRPPRVVLTSSGRERVFGDGDGVDGAVEGSAGGEARVFRPKGAKGVARFAVEDAASEGASSEFAPSEVASSTRPTLDMDLERGDFMWDYQKRHSKHISFAGSHLSP